MKFKTQDLKDALAGDHPDFETVSDEITDMSRWSVIHYWVFKHDEKFFAVVYTRGATEYQDERPFEYEGDTVECHEVRPVEKTVTVYEQMAQ